MTTTSYSVSESHYSGRNGCPYSRSSVGSIRRYTTPSEPTIVNAAGSWSSSIVSLIVEVNLDPITTDDHRNFIQSRIPYPATARGALQSAEVLYAYEPSTACFEALLCGLSGCVFAESHLAGQTI